jgi:hypothetical protein
MLGPKNATCGTNAIWTVSKRDTLQIAFKHSQVFLCSLNFSFIFLTTAHKRSTTLYCTFFIRFDPDFIIYVCCRTYQKCPIFLNTVAVPWFSASHRNTVALGSDFYGRCTVFSLFFFFFFHMSRYFLQKWDVYFELRINQLTNCWDKHVEWEHLYRVFI